MAELSFSIDLESTPEELMKLSTDYENISKYLPDQLRSVKIIEQKENGDVITEEIIRFTSIFKKDFVQQTLHKNSTDNNMESEILSGPAKGTTSIIHYKKNNSGSTVNVEIDLKLGLKYKILSMTIKKWYKQFLWGTLYRMDRVNLKGE